MPHPVPRPRQRQQRRSDHEQQDVLDHVHPEELLGEIVDRRVERRDDRRETGDERRGPPAVRGGARPGAVAAAQPVEEDCVGRVLRLDLEVLAAGGSQVSVRR